MKYFHAKQPLHKPHLTTISSKWDMPNHTESAYCPVCEKKNIAEYKKYSYGEALTPTDTCEHFSDLCSTGGTGVGFLFWVTGGNNEDQM